MINASIIATVMSPLMYLRYTKGKISTADKALKINSIISEVVRFVMMLSH